MGMDPVAPNPENIHSFNRYAYANNNPYKFVDPDGRNPELLFSSCPTCFSTGFDNPETAYSSRANALGVNLNTAEGKRELAGSMFAEAATLSTVIPAEGAVAAVLSRFAVAKFADKTKLLSHFEKHGTEFGVKSASEYLQVGREIMQQGQKVQYLYKGETRTGYVQFMGNTSRGNAKFGFVGTNADGAITTIHTQSGKSFWKLLNGSSTDKTIRPIP